ncbi:cupin domain-containing protein [Bosea sp. BK604]|uniref:cupin domain-containing protein n=1 Tax=Bosea sp. BK604 TaxID=2512180 RepID=UPI001052ABD9|nr:cupin domain-containing protein [Bosea sp. BK604]TCR64850.1 cupin domain [Bosea sp. BK604]
MDILDHASQPLDKWRDGVMTRMRVSATVQGRQLCIFEQFCEPGLGAPMHLHAVEEVLEVIEGTAEITLRDESAIMTANQSVLIPAGARHSFRNIGTGTLHVRATLAAAIFEASYDDRNEISRRFVPAEA